MKNLQITITLLLVLMIGGGIYWLNKDNTVSIQEEKQTTLSPTQIENIQTIGQWEFLVINDEEMIDTVRHGFFGDEQLVRIYYGTLRLGIDMKDVKENWIQTDKDTIVCILPSVKLLDNNFIDEAKTLSFFENGKWTGNDRQAMYNRAYTKMQKRCLTPSNIITAKNNAQTQFYKMLKAMGYANVKVHFEEEK